MLRVVSGMSIVRRSRSAALEEVCVHPAYRIYIWCRDLTLDQELRPVSQNFQGPTELIVQVSSIYALNWSCELTEFRHSGQHRCLGVQESGRL